MIFIILTYLKKIDFKYRSSFSQDCLVWNGKTIDFGDETRQERYVIVISKLFLTMPVTASPKMAKIHRDYSAHLNNVLKLSF